jgi:hypothetical protein
MVSDHRDWQRSFLPGAIVPDQLTRGLRLYVGHPGCTAENLRAPSARPRQRQRAVLMGPPRGESEGTPKRCPEEWA